MFGYTLRFIYGYFSNKKKNERKIALHLLHIRMYKAKEKNLHDIVSTYRKTNNAQDRFLPSLKLWLFCISFRTRQNVFIDCWRYGNNLNRFMSYYITIYHIRKAHSEYRRSIIQYLCTQTVNKTFAMFSFCYKTFILLHPSKRIIVRKFAFGVGWVGSLA